MRSWLAVEVVQTAVHTRDERARLARSINRVVGCYATEISANVVRLHSFWDRGVLQ